jgi:hypothetical protein
MYDAPPLSVRGVDGPSHGIVNPIFLDTESPSYAESMHTSTFSNPMYSHGGFAFPAGSVYSSTDQTHDGHNESHYDVMRFNDSRDFPDSDSRDYLDFAPTAANDGAYASRTANVGDVNEVLYEQLPKQGATVAVYAQGEVVHDVMQYDEAGYLVVDPIIDPVDPTSASRFASQSHGSATYAGHTGDGTAVVVPKSAYDRAYLVRPVKSGYDTLHGTNTALPGDDELLAPE